MSYLNLTKVNKIARLNDVGMQINKSINKQIMRKMIFVLKYQKESFEFEIMKGKLNGKRFFFQGDAKD
jgi:hypothetical protein